MLEFIVLGTLYTDALTGYDVRKCIEDGIGMFYKASYGSVYPILGRLLENGYVDCADEVRGKRVKKKYSMTPSGEIVFKEWLESDNSKGDSVESFMAKVFFFDKLPYDIACKKIDAYEDKLVEYRNGLINKKAEYETLENKDAYYYKISTLYYGICKLQSIISWCETVKFRNDLDKLVLPMVKENM